MKFIPHDVFVSMSDEIKLRMVSNQVYVAFALDDEIEYQDVFGWLCENVTELAGAYKLALTLV